MSRSVLSVVMVCAVGLVACGGSEPAKPAGAGSASAAPPATSAAAAAGAGAAEFGVPECDAYLKAYMQCVESKVPEAARAQLRASLDQSKQAWKQAASTPQGKAGLVMACTQARDASRMAMKTYGCEL